MKDQGILNEMRKSIRFPITLEAHLTGHGLNFTGVTVNVSSGGALILADADVPQGTPVQLHVKWPASLEMCDLKLVLTGSVVWTRGSLIAIRRKGYEFRTVAKKRQPRHSRAPAA